MVPYALVCAHNNDIRHLNRLPSFRSRIPFRPVLVYPGIRSVIGKTAFNTVHIGSVGQFISCCRVAAEIHKLHHIRSRITRFTLIFAALAGLALALEPAQQKALVFRIQEKYAVCFLRRKFHFHGASFRIIGHIGGEDISAQ